MITSLAVAVAYCIYVFNQYQAGFVLPGDLKFWAKNMLIFIGIHIGAAILIQIIFHILLSVSIAVKEKMQNGTCDDEINEIVEESIEQEFVTDEREKLVGLKASRIGFIVMGIGFVAGLVSILADYSAVTMLNILYLSFYVGTLCDGASQIYFYRKGV
jgi:hypothetical protein